MCLKIMGSLIYDNPSDVDLQEGTPITGSSRPYPTCIYIYNNFIYTYTYVPARCVQVGVAISP